MNWVFLDLIDWDYDVATPLEKPLGGSQSALCYLAAALARRGHRVTTLTGATAPRVIGGVNCLHHENFPAEIFSPPDTIVIVLNGPADFAARIREVIPPGRRLVLWTQHAHDQPAMLPLREPACHTLWDRIVCISQWQKAMFEQHLGVPPARMELIRNAISPAFENLFRDESELADAKSHALRLAYTSSPYRGLDVLLACFPAIHRRHPACRLEVFSSMQVYGQPKGADPYEPLYSQCRTTTGIDYKGALSQTALARELSRASLLAYPNTFAETSCIVVMEALAAGLLVVTSDLAALPETTAGYARLVPAAGPSRSSEQFAIDFARTTDHALTELAANHHQFMRDRYLQSQAVNAACNWDLRATQWQEAAAAWLTLQ